MSGRWRVSFSRSSAGFRWFEAEVPQSSKRPRSALQARKFSFIWHGSFERAAFHFYPLPFALCLLIFSCGSAALRYGFPGSEPTQIQTKPKRAARYAAP